MRGVARLEEVAHETAGGGLAALAGDGFAVDVGFKYAEAGDGPVGLAHLASVGELLHEAGGAVLGFLLLALLAVRRHGAVRAHLGVRGGDPHGALPVILREESGFEEALRGLEPCAGFIAHFKLPDVLGGALEGGSGVGNAD